MNLKRPQINRSLQQLQSFQTSQPSITVEHPLTMLTSETGSKEKIHSKNSLVLQQIIKDFYPQALGHQHQGALYNTKGSVKLREQVLPTKIKTPQSQLLTKFDFSTKNLSKEIQKQELSPQSVNLKELPDSNLQFNTNGTVQSRLNQFFKQDRQTIAPKDQKFQNKFDPLTNNNDVPQNQGNEGVKKSRNGRKQMSSFNRKSSRGQGNLTKQFSVLNFNSTLLHPSQQSLMNHLIDSTQKRKHSKQHERAGNYPLIKNQHALDQQLSDFLLQQSKALDSQQSKAQNNSISNFNHTISTLNPLLTQQSLFQLHKHSLGMTQKLQSNLSSDLTENTTNLETKQLKTKKNQQPIKLQKKTDSVSSPLKISDKCHTLRCSSIKEACERIQNDCLSIKSGGNDEMEIGSNINSSQKKKQIYSSYLNAFETNSVEVSNANCMGMNEEHKSSNKMRPKTALQDQGGKQSSLHSGNLKELQRCATALQQNQLQKIAAALENATPASQFQKHFDQFQFEVTEKENNQVNKEMFLIRNKMHAYVECCQKAVRKLQQKVANLEKENAELKMWKKRQLQKTKHTQQLHKEKGKGEIC